jgi:transcriptional regulator with XRE-family HTH domain
MRTRTPLSVAFGQVVRDLRTRAELSQERLGFLSKLSRNYIGQVERGENSPTLDAVSAIAKALGTTVRELISAAEERLR